jgi:hypothetical protein
MMWRPITSHLLSEYLWRISLLVTAFSAYFASQKIARCNLFTGAQSNQITGNWTLEKKELQYLWIMYKNTQRLIDSHSTYFNWEFRASHYIELQIAVILFWTIKIYNIIIIIICNFTEFLLHCFFVKSSG